MAEESERISDSMLAIVSSVPLVLRLQWFNRSLFVRLRLMAVDVGFAIPACFSTSHWATLRRSTSSESHSKIQ